MPISPMGCSSSASATRRSCAPANFPAGVRASPAITKISRTPIASSRWTMSRKCFSSATIRAATCGTTANPRLPTSSASRSVTSRPRPADAGGADRSHRVAVVLLGPGRVAGGRDVAEAGAVGVDREEVDHRSVVVRPELLAADLDADELPLDAFLLDASKRFLPDEGGLLVEIDHPLVAHVHLVRVRVEPHVRAEREDAGFDALDVTGPDDLKLVRLAGFEHD